jgi:hypothetical protein
MARLTRVFPTRFEILIGASTLAYCDMTYGAEDYNKSVGRLEENAVQNGQVSVDGAGAPAAPLRSRNGCPEPAFPSHFRLVCSVKRRKDAADILDLSVKFRKTADDEGRHNDRRKRRRQTFDSLAQHSVAQDDNPVGPRVTARWGPGTSHKPNSTT